VSDVEAYEESQSSPDEPSLFAKKLVELNLSKEMEATLEQLKNGERVQHQLPDLGSKGAKAKFAAYNADFPIQYPRSATQVKQWLLLIGYCLIKHEKHGSIWKRQVRKLEN
jgi:hypothetical protein